MRDHVLKNSTNQNCPVTTIDQQRMHVLKKWCVPENLGCFFGSYRRTEGRTDSGPG